MTDSLLPQEGQARLMEAEFFLENYKPMSKEDFNILEANKSTEGSSRKLLLSDDRWLCPRSVTLSQSSQIHSLLPQEASCL